MNKKIIIGIILVVAIGFGGWKIWPNTSEGDANEPETSTSTNANNNKNSKESNNQQSKEKDSSEENNKQQSKNQDSKDSTIDNKDTKQDSKENKKVDGVDNNSKSESDKSDSNSKSDETSQSVSSTSSTNSSHSKTPSSKTQSSSNSIKTPYKVSSTGMEVNKIYGFSGTFVEDGSNKNVSNILCLQVKNTSKKDLQYGQIKLKVNDKKTATFEITNLPAGKTVTVTESSGSIAYNSGDNYKYEDATYSLVDKLPMSSDKVKVTTSGSTITIENISDKDLGTVYVYYKNTKDGSYLGGITYRAKFEDVKKGQSYSGNASHYSDKNSEIVMIDTEN